MIIATSASGNYFNVTEYSYSDGISYLSSGRLRFKRVKSRNQESVLCKLPMEGQNLRPTQPSPHLWVALCQINSQSFAAPRRLSLRLE